MYYIASKNTNPYFNLALEQYVFDKLDPAQSYFMLWQNHNSIIVGKHQNTVAEINAAFVKERDITVARRLSGGGAVYHDLGNLNFTFITDADQEKGIDFAAFCKPVQNALASFGVDVNISGRNDMTIDGKKFSGNSQYVKHGRVMHHGTLMYDSDLSVVAQALNVSKDKIESKGIKSVRSRITNIRPYMTHTDVTTEIFWDSLKNYMFKAYDMNELELTVEDIENVKNLRDTFYSKWDWNYGKSPEYTIQKKRRIESCGTIEVLLDIEKAGKIRNISFFGDFFSKNDPEEIVTKFTECRYERDEVKKILSHFDISDYFTNLDTETFISILFE